jgi:hypothetical protein
LPLANQGHFRFRQTQQADKHEYRIGYPILYRNDATFFYRYNCSAAGYFMAMPLLNLIVHLSGGPI